MKYILSIIIIIIITNIVHAQNMPDSIICLPAQSIIDIAERAKFQESENLTLKALNTKYLIQNQTYEKIRALDSITVMNLNSQVEILNSIQSMQIGEIAIYKNQNSKYKKYIKFFVMTTGIFFGMYLIK